jgi:MOSC domain-containing protein YiiM
VTGRLTAVCVSGVDLPAVPGRKPVRTGIDKRPVGGRVAVRELGLNGDVHVNRKYHGGEGQAVYAYAQEDADFWIAELGRELPPGRFGENLRTTGLDLVGAVLGRAVADRDGAVRVEGPSCPPLLASSQPAPAAPGPTTGSPWPRASGSS